MFAPLPLASALLAALLLLGPSSASADHRATIGIGVPGIQIYAPPLSIQFGVPFYTPYYYPAPYYYPPPPVPIYYGPRYYGPRGYPPYWRDHRGYERHGDHDRRRW